MNTLVVVEAAILITTSVDNLHIEWQKKTQVEAAEDSLIIKLILILSTVSYTQERGIEYDCGTSIVSYFSGTYLHVCIPMVAVIER